MGDKIGVLYVISGLAIGEPLGGAERFGVELARNIDQDVCTPVVCAFWQRGGAAEQYWYRRLREANVEVFFAAPWQGGFSFPRFLRGVQRLKNHLRGRAIDVIHSHFQVGSIASLLAVRALGCRSLLRTAHITVEWGPSKMGYLCRQIFTKWVFPALFDAEIGVSRFIVDQLNARPGARLSGKKAIFVPNGVSLDRFSPKGSLNKAQFADIGIDPDKLVIGSVGRLTEQKGYRYLIEAMPTILREYPEVQLLIVGDGELRDELGQQVKQLGLDNDVILSGSRQDVEALLGIMDVLVLPSLWEGLPTVVLEGMASGAPVVATDIPGTRELIEHGSTGWLAEVKNPSALANAALDALKSEPRRAEVARRALATVIPQYSMQSIASRHQELYGQSVSASRRGAALSARWK